MSLLSLLLISIPLIVYSGYTRDFYVGEACFSAKSKNQPQLRAPISGRVERVRIQYTKGGVRCHGYE